MDTLFDATIYGPEPHRRAKVERPTEVRLQEPWVLLRHHTGPPLAHLVTDRMKATERDAIAARNGAVRTQCGRYGQPLIVEGHPMAKLCSTCWRTYEQRH